MSHGFWLPRDTAGCSAAMHVSTHLMTIFTLILTFIFFSLVLLEKMYVTAVEQLVKLEMKVY